MIHRRSFQRFILSTALFLGTTLAVSAQSTPSTTDIPRTISYQGLLSSHGIPFSDGHYEISVTLYADPLGGAPIWNSSYTAQVSNGVFNLLLGQDKPLPGSQELNRPLWIGTSVNGEEMRPLTPLTASPYAFNVPDQAVTTGKLADGAVTAEKLGIDYISAIQVDGQQITAKGTVLNLVGTPNVPLSYDEATQSLTIGKAAAQTGDKEKETSTLASPLAWDSQGDLTDGTTGGQATTAGDWLGTSSSGSNGQYDLDFRVEGEPVMLYQTAGAGRIPNVIGGQSNTVSNPAATQGSIIAEGLSNSINNGDYQVISGGERNTINNGHHNGIGSGGTNTISESEYSAIGGGDINIIGSADIATHHSVIGGGWDNEIYASEATIAGGHNNTVYSYASTIGGGHDNVIADNSMFSFIGGGQNNVLRADYTTIGGGTGNNVTDIHSTIGGGINNNIYGPESTIGGGENNTVRARWGTVAGGANNGVSADMGTVGGGENNQVTAPEATIAGGHRNQVHAYVSVVGGGHNNFIWRNSTYSTISGGLVNVMGNSLTNPAVTHSAIGGGENNAIGSTGATAVTHSTISGGQNNLISTASGVQIDNATIGGGQGSTTESSYTTISGGLTNVIGTNSPMATIGGGGQNTVRAAEATIAGGHRNTVESYVSTIAGGHSNLISSTSQAGFIGSGWGNRVDAPMATIGGGENNNARGTHTTIPGGDGLQTVTSYAQSSMGFFNAARGGMALRPNAGTIAASNDPLFMIGNGDYNGGIPIRSNAFEVSYNGHSTVYGVNGSGAANPSITGATYVDNVLYAWGDIAAGGGINSDFGVASVTFLGGGVYDITITVNDPLGNPVTLRDASITATIVDNPDGKIGCAVITTTQMGAIGANSFRIRTYSLAGGSCKEADLPFMFKVTGRP